MNETKKIVENISREPLTRRLATLRTNSVSDYQFNFVLLPCLLWHALSKGSPNGQQHGHVELQLQRERKQSFRVGPGQGQRQLPPRATGAAARASEAAEPRGLVAGGRALVVALDEGGKTEGVSRTRSFVFFQDEKTRLVTTEAGAKRAGGNDFQTCTM